MSDPTPEDVAGWTHSLDEAESNYRSIAECQRPLDKCPWSEADHAEARIIVHLLNRRDKRIVTLEAVVQGFVDFHTHPTDGTFHGLFARAKTVIAAREYLGPPEDESDG